MTQDTEQPPATREELWDMHPTAKVCVAVMSDNTVCVTGDLSSLTGVEARKIAYALMSAGAHV